jgi:hypothetical protein
MGLKGYRLWVMGQLDSTCSAPPRDVRPLQPVHLHQALQLRDDDSSKKQRKKREERKKGLVDGEGGGRGGGGGRGRDTFR